ncbi:hypothetical protein [Bartonella schoenbuchensis]|uniref:hypothetical protein n=1 Tax=Bartonella schoenbuchensis TaxID=165694 RepID=UPI0031451929
MWALCGEGWIRWWRGGDVGEKMLKAWFGEGGSGGVIGMFRRETLGTVWGSAKWESAGVRLWRGLVGDEEAE